MNSFTKSVLLAVFVGQAAAQFEDKIDFPTAATTTKTTDPVVSEKPAGDDYDYDFDLDDSKDYDDSEDYDYEGFDFGYDDEERIPMDFDCNTLETNEALDCWYQLMR